MDTSRRPNQHGRAKNLVFTIGLGVATLCFVLCAGLSDLLLGIISASHPLRSAIESVTATTALILAGIFANLVFNRGIERRYGWLAACLVSVGSMELIHSAMELNSFDHFYHSLIMLVSGSLLLTATFQIMNRRRFSLSKVILVGVGASVPIGLMGEFVLGLNSAHFNEDTLRTVANCFNLLGACFFLYVSGRALWDFFTEGKNESWYFGVFAYSFGLSGITFSFAHTWDAAWWLASFFQLVGLFCLIMAGFRNVQALNRDLEETHSLLSTVKNGTSDLIFTKNLEGQYRIINAAFEQLTEKLASEIVGRTDDELFEKAKAARYKEADQAVYETKKSQTSQVIVKTRRGDRIFMVSKTPFNNADGRLSGLVGVGRDITDLVEARDLALQASRAKTQFLANMSHEIRTPLNGVLGMTEILSFTTLDAEQRSYVETINASAASLLEVMNNILSLSNSSETKIRQETVLFDLYQMVTTVVDGARKAALAKGLNLRMSLEQNVATKLKGDAKRVAQVLSNLVSNAIKFTFAGEIEIKVSCIQAPENIRINRLLFSVRDTGIGISDESKDGLFEAFAQADNSSTRKFGGTGLGLAICKRTIEDLEGKIGFESQEGQGSTFWFQVDLERQVDFAPASLEPGSANVSENELNPQKSEVDVPASSVSGAAQPVAPNQIASELELQRRRGQRILVAEDNALNQKIALKMLKKLGFEATGVDNGLEALKLLSTNEFDLVLMDCHMPQLDGYDATKAIRAEKNSGYSQIPVIALTASALAGEREKCLAVGMDDYLVKPIQASLLGQTLDRWLSTKNLNETANG